MTPLTLGLLGQCIKQASSADIAKYASSINDTCSWFEIDSDLRLAGFLSELAIECQYLARMEENLNYKAASLLAVFPSHFTTDEVDAYAHQPEKIADRVYANRNGNGDEASGDGYKYRGRGAFQVTFLDNYIAFGTAVNQDFVSNPDLVATPDWCIASAGWFWKMRNINPHADAQDVPAMRRCVNGGTNGLAEVQAVYADCCVALGLNPPS